MNQNLTINKEEGLAVVDPSTLTLEQAKRMVEEMAKSESWRKIDAIEQEMEAHPESFFEIPTKHIFTPGLYVRQVFMKKGRFITTRIHLTEHPYIVSFGRALIWTDDDGVIEFDGDHIGVTKPGARRLLYILEDMLWATCHANPDNERDPDKIVARSTYNNRELRIKSEAVL